MNKLLIALLVMFVVASLFIDDSDAWRRRRRRRRNGKMDENEMPVSTDQGQGVPADAKEKILAAFADLETSEDDSEEYDIHPKHAI
ncbi:hypothetical protein ACROYT_G003745 [Oculina patagonica]